MDSRLAGRPPGRAAFAFIFVTVVIDMLALGLIIPVLPRLILTFEAGDASQGAAIYGLFGSVFAGAQFLFSPVLGSLSDRFGRRRVILVSNIGLGLDYLLMAMAPTLAWLFVGRIVSGITSSTYGTAGAYITDVTPPEQRAAKFGLLGVAFGIGFILGPTAGGLLASFGLRAPFWAAAGLSLVNAIYGLFILPESLPTERRSPFHWKNANPIGSLRFLRSKPYVLGLATAAFLSMLAHDALPSTFVLYTTHRYQWDERTIGLVLTAVGVASLVVQGGLIGRLVSALGERRAMAAGFLSGAAGMVIYGLAPTGGAFLAGIPLTALYGLSNPSLQSLMTREVHPNEQGQLQGAQGSLMGMASMTAPIIFTQVFSLSVGRYRDLNIPGTPFLLAGALLVAALVVSWRVTSRPPD